MIRCASILFVLALAALSLVSAGPNVREHEHVNRFWATDSLGAGVVDTSHAVPVFGARTIHVYVQTDTVVRPGLTSVDTLANFVIQASVDDGQTWSPLALGTGIDSTTWLSWRANNLLAKPLDKGLATSRTVSLTARIPGTTTSPETTPTTHLRFLSTPATRKRCTTCTGNAPMRGYRIDVRVQF